jgi:serine/threonine protein kinase
MLDSKFILRKFMGQGGSSKVYKVDHPESEESYAVKIIRKDKGISQHKGARILSEEHDRMVILEGHPNILRSYGTFNNGRLSTELGSNNVSYNVIELAENGTFSHFIINYGNLGETLSKFPFMQVCSAIQYIHSKGIAHMDVKLENILLDKYFNAKVADLGVALDVAKTNGLTDSRRGTQCYMAPEVNYLLPTEIFDAYKADIYSLGICLYAMIFGELPLKKEDDSTFSFDTDTLGTITGLKCSIDCRKKWDHLSIELQELLSNMLSMDPEERHTFEEIFESEWIQEAYHEEMPYQFHEEMLHRMFLKAPKSSLYDDNQGHLWLEGQLDTFNF